MDPWESLGGDLAPGSAPSATSWAANEQQVFAVFRDGRLWSRYWDGAAWHEWHTHGGELGGSPAACSWGADRIDVFAHGRNGGIWHIWYEPSGWQAWERLPIGADLPLSAELDAVSWGPDRIDLFARDANGTLLHAHWDGTAWH